MAAGAATISAAIFGIRTQGDFGNTASRSEITSANLARIVTTLERPAIGLSRRTDLAEAGAVKMLQEPGDRHSGHAQRRLELP